MECVLVTGGAGFVGAQTCKALKEAGFLPIVYDNLSTGNRWAVKWGPLIESDLLDRVALKKTFETFRPSAVLHFAGSTHIFESIHYPEKYYQNNTLATLALLEAMREAKVPYLIFSSTCATYGHPQKLPISESHPQMPISPYGTSKWMAEKLLADFERAYGILSISLRYFNAAGADLDLEIGESQRPTTRLISSAIQHALENTPLSVYGKNFPTKDGTAVRDYIHVCDLAKAHVSALRLLFKTKKSEQINLGSGKGFSVLEIIEKIETLSQKKIAVQFFAKREGDPAVLIADFQKAKELLNWQPELSLEEILASSLLWQKKRRSAMLQEKAKSS